MLSYSTIGPSSIAQAPEGAINADLQPPAASSCLALVSTWQVLITLFDLQLQFSSGPEIVGH